MIFVQVSQQPWRTWRTGSIGCGLGDTWGPDGCVIEGGGAGEACIVVRQLSQRTIGKAGPRLPTHWCLLPHLTQSREAEKINGNADQQLKLSITVCVTAAQDKQGLYTDTKLLRIVVLNNQGCMWVPAADAAAWERTGSRAVPTSAPGRAWGLLGWSASDPGAAHFTTVLY